MTSTRRACLASALIVLVLLSGCSHEADFPMPGENQTNDATMVVVRITGNATGTEYYRFTMNVSAGASSETQQVAFEPNKADREALVCQATAGNRTSRYETSMFSSVEGWTIRVLEDQIHAPLVVV